MWRYLWNLLCPPKPINLITKVIDFTQPRKDHWLSYEGGDNFDACFAIRGQVLKGDEVLVRMRSGRIGCYSLFSVMRDFTGKADWRAKGIAVGYADEVVPKPRVAALPASQVTGLDSDGTWRVQPDAGKLVTLSHGFTMPTSEFWKVFARHEACRHGSNSMRATGNL